MNYSNDAKPFCAEALKNSEKEMHLYSLNDVCLDGKIRCKQCGHIIAIVMNGGIEIMCNHAANQKRCKTINRIQL
jgi:hypothetical protein